MPYLPGQFVPVSTSVAYGYGDECDCGQPAITCMVGETDSFGSEFHPMCAICKHEHDNREDTEEEGICDWCRKVGVLSPRRDFEEGSSGPVYHVCSPCIRKENEKLAREAGYDMDDDYY